MPAETIFLIIAAPFIGSFLGLVARRLPQGRALVTGRSACETCGRKLKPAELIPFVSYLAQRGRCACGKVRLSLFYPVIEFLALIVVLMALPVRTGTLLCISAALGWTLLILAAIDQDSYILPDRLTLPLIAAGLALTWWFSPGVLGDHVIGAVAGFVALTTINLLYRRLRGHDGLGGGDAKLLAAAGAWLGWAALPQVLLIAALTAVSATMIGMLAGKVFHGCSRIAFGPYLTLGFWLVWLVG